MKGLTTSCSDSRDKRLLIAMAGPRKRTDRVLLQVALAIVILLSSIAIAKDSIKEHKDYVPDQKTAERIAEAVLAAQFGETRVNAEGPLLVDGSNKDFWIVELAGGKDAMPQKGGGPAVWINKHSGCLRVMDHMK